MKRILFIDDEPVLLDGLRRMLRPLRTEWELEFESSPRAALARMDAEHFDVVVTDMRMPVIDGVGVLTHVTKRHPQTIRLVLTGYAQLESSIRAVPLAHQFLLKPCDPDRLKAAIGRITRMQVRLRDPELRALLGGVKALPAVPSVCSELNDLLARPDFTVRDVAAIAEKDPAVCAKILQIVNSAFFGLGRRITYIHDAVGYLGTTLLKNLTSAVALWQALESVSHEQRAQQDRVLRHSQVVAALAKRMLGEDRTKREEAFVAGLLHDVGEMILLAHLPDRYLAAQAEARAQQVSLRDAERSLYRVDHTEIGAYLLEAWGLPYAVLEAAAYHHGAEELGHTALEPADAVYLANVLLAARERACSPHELVTPGYLERLGVEANVGAWLRWAEEV